MGQLAAQLERISVEAVSPDGRITAGVHGRLRLTLEFRGRAYGSYPDHELGHQLGRVADLAWVRYHREYAEVEAAFTDGYQPDRDPVDRRFEQQAAELTVTGSSPSGWVTIASRALASWTVEVRAGAQRELAEDRFVAEVLAAAAATLGAYRAARSRLLHEYYDLAGALPRERR